MLQLQSAFAPEKPKQAFIRLSSADKWPVTVVSAGGGTRAGLVRGAARSGGLCASRQQRVFYRLCRYALSYGSSRKCVSHGFELQKIQIHPFNTSSLHMEQDILFQARSLMLILMSIIDMRDLSRATILCDVACIANVYSFT